MLDLQDEKSEPGTAATGQALESRRLPVMKFASSSLQQRSVVEQPSSAWSLEPGLLHWVELLKVWEVEKKKWRLA